MSRVAVLAGLAGVLLGGAGVAAFSDRAPPPTDRTATEGVVRDYLLAHPEIIPEAMDRLEAKRAGQRIAANRAAIETPFAGAAAGAADGDVTLVEFFDYACGFCRTSVGDVERLLAEDPKLRVVFRELPILGEPSDAAARAGLAAARQGRYAAFHRAMYAGDRPSAASIAAAERAAGLDPARLAADEASPAVERELDANIGLARAIGFHGTPTFVVGDAMLSGAIGYDALKKAVAEARAAKAG